ncbi:MAG: biopolymer transporter ExbD [Sheuella sp.]|nr:biopolymer transporter ExbD [Sheuella sp.]
MSFEMSTDTDDGINEINMTPFVDVMLVLLVIFIVTIPVVKQAIELDLPNETGTVLQDNTETIEISVSENGDFFYDGILVSDEDLSFKFKMLSEQKSHLHSDNPSIQIRGDKNVKYARIAMVMALAQSNGLNRIGFVMHGIGD